MGPALQPAAGRPTVSIDQMTCDRAPAGGGVLGVSLRTPAHTTARPWHPDCRARPRSIAVAVPQATPSTDRLDAQIALAVVGVLVFQAEIAKPYRIPSASMEPTLHCGKPADGCRSRVSDRVIANRIAYRFHAPERGDIIVFNAPARVKAACNASGAFVKRIVGLPGDRVSMQDGHVLINGVRLKEPYLAPAYRGRESGEWPRSPRSGCFVLGDNRAMSCDSRRWGVVPRESIIGRVDIRYWPPNRAGEP